jgi:hypothetical protein
MYELAFMSGDRASGYYYIRLQSDHDCIVCKGGHPEFPYYFSEDKEGKEKGQKTVDKLNAARGS